MRIEIAGGSGRIGGDVGPARGGVGSTRRHRTTDMAEVTASAGNGFAGSRPGIALGNRNIATRPVAHDATLGIVQHKKGGRVRRYGRGKGAAGGDRRFRPEHGTYFAIRTEVGAWFGVVVITVGPGKLIGIDPDLHLSDTARRRRVVDIGQIKSGIGIDIGIANHRRFDGIRPALAKGVGRQRVWQIALCRIVAGQGGDRISLGHPAGTGDDRFGIHCIRAGHADRAQIDRHRTFVSAVQVHRKETIA